MRKRGEPFFSGYEIQSLTVVSVKSEASRVCDWWYTVRHSACGHETDITHKSILQRRAQKHSGLCPTCGRIKGAKNMMETVKKRNADKTARQEMETEESKQFAWANKLWPMASGNPVVW